MPAFVVNLRGDNGTVVYHDWFRGMNEGLHVGASF